MYDWTMFEQSGDETRERTIELKNGRKVTFKKDGVFGFWTIHYDKGSMPVKLTGKYTSFEQAERALNNYLDRMEKGIQDDQPLWDQRSFQQKLEEEQTDRVKKEIKKQVATAATPA